jgi:hypothetical protein
MLEESAIDASLMLEGSAIIASLGKWLLRSCKLRNRL